MIDVDKEGQIGIDSYHVHQIVNIINSNMKVEDKIKFISARIRNNAYDRLKVWKVVETLMMHRMKQGAIKNV